MTSDPMLKRPLREAYREILKQLFTPLTIAWLVIVLTMQYWMTPVIYVLLRTLLFDPNAILVKSLLIGISCFCLWSWFSFFKAIIEFSKRMRPLIQASKNGDNEAAKQHLELRSQRPSPHMFIRGLFAFHLVVPLIVVMVLSQGQALGDYLVRDHGKLRHSTRQENVRDMLKAVEARGIFRPIGN